MLLFVIASMLRYANSSLTQDASSLDACLVNVEMRSSQGEGKAASTRKQVLSAPGHEGAAKA